MAAQAGGIGARLRAGRERMGLTVLQAAEKLHLDARILELLEAENFDALGAAVYARGHLRHYAQLIGESVEELNALYSSARRPDEPDLTRIAKAPSNAESNRLVVAAVMVLGVFAGAGAIWWVLSLSKGGRGGQGIELPVETAQPPAASSPESATPPKKVPQALTSTTGAPIKLAVAPRAVQAPAAAAASPTSAVGSQAASAGAAGQPSRQPAAAVDSAAAGTGSAVPPARAGRASQLTLRFTADSWTEVYDASGEKVFYDVGAANSVHEVKAALPLRVVLGNAAGVSIIVNGHDTPIDKLSNADGSAQIVINRAGRAVRAKSPADGG